MLIVQQEILLHTNNTFCQKQWCEKEMAESSKEPSQMEQLEAACWNGLIGEFLPEVLERARPGKKLFLWQIRKGASSLHIQLSESTVQLDKQDSIDPSLFMTSLLLIN